jgi:predicted N-formylglutamate amidohydrolase
MKKTHLLISCEHATNHVPASYAHLFPQQDEQLNSHRAWDMGALTIAKQLSQALQCELTETPVSRLLIDCSRSLSNKACFSEFSSPLSAVEKQQLITDYYLPYRQQTEHLIKKHIDDGLQVFHISSHSFSPVLNGLRRNAGIGLLYDPKRHAEKEVAREWAGLLSQQTTYKIRMNYPYSGKSNGLTNYLRHQYSEKNYVGLGLEINQDAIKDKTSIDILAQALSNSLKELLELL